jgi:outer membrane protein
VSVLRKALLAACVAPFAFGLPQSANAESVLGAMAKAYQNNPDLNAARAGLRATDEGVPIAKAGMRPTISAEVDLSATRIDGHLPRVGIDREQETATAGLVLTQPVFDGFQTLNNIRAAESNVFVSREQLRGTQISILQAAAQAYADVARDKEIVTIRRQNLGFLQEQLKAANARLQVGEGTRTDVAQAQAQLSAAQALLQSAIAQEKSSEAVYTQIVGVRPVGVKLPSPLTRRLPTTLTEALEIGRRENPTILAAQYSVDVAGYNVKSAEGTLLPGVNLQGSVQTDNTGSTTSTIAAQLVIPLYQGGAASARVRQSKELLGQSRIQVDSARRQVDQQIITTWTQFKAFQANIDAEQASVKAARLALNGVIEERKVGQRTTLDVLNSQQTALTARESLVQARTNSVVASYTLLAYMGRLTVSNLGLNVAEYHPEDHYKRTKDRWFGLRTVDGR